MTYVPSIFFTSINSDEFVLKRGDHMYRLTGFLPRECARRQQRRRGRRRLQPTLYAAEPLEPRVFLAIPHIGSADAAPNPTVPGAPLTFTAHNVTGTIDELDFYRESNGVPGLQPGITISDDFLVAVGIPAAGGTYTATSQAPFIPGTPGTYTYYAVAYSDTGQKSNAVSFQNTVETPPTVTDFIDLPDPAPFNGVINLTAIVSDPDDGGVPATVFVYRESNNIAGCQIGQGGDFFVGNMGAPIAGANHLQVMLSGLPLGTYTYYCFARDAFGAPSPLAVQTNTIADAFEPNDRFETAHDLGSAPFGSLTNQSFLDGGDHDFFRLTAPRTTNLKISVAPDQWTQQIRVNVYDANRNLLSSTILDPYGANHFLLSPVTASQSYYLDFSLASGIAGPYNFSYDYAPTVTAVADSPDPQTPQLPVTLTLQGKVDENADYAVFFRESNGTPGLQEGSDTQLRRRRQRRRRA
jgi:hypothetical protein